MGTRKGSATGSSPSANEKNNYDLRLKEALQDIAAHESGIFFLRHLRKECGFGDINTVVNAQTGEILMSSTVYNNAQENIYKVIRQYLPKKAKIQIEINK